MPGHHHRAGSLRQTNKKNKRYKSSKRSASREAGGKVANHKQSGARNAAQSKSDRRNHQQQKRNAKRQDILRKKRGLGGVALPSRLVGIVSLSATHGLEERLKYRILSEADQFVHTYNDAPNATVSCKFNVHKKDGALTLLTPSSFNHYGDDDDAFVLAALDLARVCDLLLFVVDGNAKIDDTPLEIHIGDNHSTGTSKTASKDYDHLICSRGDRALTAIKGQGLPTIITVLAHTEKDAFGHDEFTMQSVKSLRRAGIKRHLELKKYMNRFALTEFGSDQDKVLEVDLSEVEKSVMTDDDEAEEHVDTSCAALVRAVCQASAIGPKFVSEVPRSLVVADSIEYDENLRELSLCGYVRGMVPLDVNALFHVPNVGTFACKAVVKATRPFSRLVETSDSVEEDNLDEVRADPERQESLEMFATPDALDGEQNLVGFDEDMAAEPPHEDDKFARPAGWSTYQSAWLDAVDEDNFDDAIDAGEMAKELNQRNLSSAMSLGGEAMDLEDANDVNAADKRAIKEQRRKEMQDHLEFPDEVEVDEDVKASERFARYRSLKSFRKSYWDPKENLPESYAMIYHFSNFRATQRAVMNDMKDVMKAAENSLGSFWGKGPDGALPEASMSTDSDEEDEDLLFGCVPSGSYVRLILSDVPVDQIQSLKREALLSAVSLLPHENKVSVLHVGLSQTLSCDVTEENPVKSKDVLVFRCGWRTWKSRPIFSQNNLNCDKHKFERFMPTRGAFFAASVFGPVTYTPCPVLVFREGESGRQLIAIGSMIGADADRIAVKRIVLTGFPVRVQKRWATVKYMFYNPDDVKWFKPAGLYTKHGLQGNIEDSVGEHGTMKCLFNAPIKQHDTVCLPLYKRIFPKFAPADDRDTNEGINGKPFLLVL